MGSTEHLALRQSTAHEIHTTRFPVFSHHIR
jgi:hypothetical protein